MNSVPDQPHLAPEVQRLLDALKPKANSLIVTVFGDSIMPRGGAIWLGELANLMNVFGMSDRLVRTGVYRLSQDGLLESRSKGRRARYSLTEHGLKSFEEAGQRIYAANAPQSEDQWTLVQGLPDLDQSERQTLRRRLKWLGFGQFSTSMMALPSAEPESLQDELRTAGLASKVLVFKSEYAAEGRTLLEAANAAWPLDEINQEYTRFNAAFEVLSGQQDLHWSPADAFALRTLLIHEYRRILLKDPHLPSTLLPNDWSGDAARDLSARLYRQIAAEGAAHVEALADIEPNLKSSYWNRFNGLPRKLENLNQVRSAG